MATLYETDFESYSVGTGSFAGEGWDFESAAVTTSQAHGGTKSVELQAGAGAIHRDVTVPALDFTFRAWWFIETGATHGPVIMLSDFVNSSSWQFRLFSSGGSRDIELYAEQIDASPQTLLATLTDIYPLDTWFELEIRLRMATTPGGTDGALQVLIDGVVVYDDDGIAMTHVIEGIEIEGGDAFIDDILVTDDPIAGATRVNDFALGDQMTIRGASNAMGIALDGDPHVLSDDNTFEVWADNVRLHGAIELDGAVTGGASDPRRVVYPLGGSRHQAVRHNAAVDAYDYLDIEIDGDDLAGATVRARVEVRTSDAGTSVTPKIRQVSGTPADAVTGAACAATNPDYSGTNQKQTLTFTPAAGVQKYRLMLTPSNNSNDVWGIGYLEIFF